MGKKEMMKQMIDAHKIYFENFFSTMVTYQIQAEKLLQNFVDHAPGISDEGKKVIDQWNDAYKKGIEDFKKAVEDGYTKVETLIDLDAMFMSDKMLTPFMSQNNLVPQNYFKDVMEEWTNMYNKNMKSMEEFFSAANNQQTNAKKKK